MAQNQRKQAGWKHEIDRIAGGDFERYVSMTTHNLKMARWAAVSGWGTVLLILAMVIVKEVIL